MKEKYEDSLEYNTKVADTMLAVLLGFDIFSERFDVVDLRKVLKKMQGQASHVKAFPSQETLSKGNSMQSQCNVFEKILDLMEARKEQREVEKRESAESGGQHMLKMMGLT